LGARNRPMLSYDLTSLITVACRQSDDPITSGGNLKNVTRTAVIDLAKTGVGLARQAVRNLKTQSPHDVSVAGPNLAAQAIRAGLVDEYHLLVVPMMRGGGKRVLPSDVCVKLDLLDERRFAMEWSTFAITRGPD
jgi:riboflavin biosynthesis pyrimidine reductase